MRSARSAFSATTSRVTSGVTNGLPSRSPPTHEPSTSGRASSGTVNPAARTSRSNSPTSSGTVLRRQLLQVPADRARLVGDRGLARPDLVGLPQQVDERRDLVVVRPAVERLADPAQHPQHRLARRLGGVRGEHRPQLEPLQGLLHLGARLPGELLGQPLHERRAAGGGPPAAANAARGSGAAARRCSRAGSTGRTRGSARRRCPVSSPESSVRDLRAAALRRLPRQPADLLDQLQQLRAAVVGEGPAEHGGQPADVGAQRLVLGLGDDAGGGGDRIGGLGDAGGQARSRSVSLGYSGVVGPLAAVRGAVHLHRASARSADASAGVGCHARSRHAHRRLRRGKSAP